MSSFRYLGSFLRDPDGAPAFVPHRTTPPPVPPAHPDVRVPQAVRRSISNGRGLLARVLGDSMVPTILDYDVAAIVYRAPTDGEIVLVRADVEHPVYGHVGACVWRYHDGTLRKDNTRYRVSRSVTMDEVIGVVTRILQRDQRNEYEHYERIQEINALQRASGHPITAEMAVGDGVSIPEVSSLILAVPCTYVVIRPVALPLLFVGFVGCVILSLPPRSDWKRRSTPDCGEPAVTVPVSSDWYITQRFVALSPLSVLPLGMMGSVAEIAVTSDVFSILYFADAVLLDFRPLNAFALTVVVSVMVSGPLYLDDLSSGVLPLVVYRIVAFRVDVEILTLTDPVYVPASGENLGFATVAAPTTPAYATITNKQSVLEHLITFPSI